MLQSRPGGVLLVALLGLCLTPAPALAQSDMAVFQVSGIEVDASAADAVAARQQAADAGAIRRTEDLARTMTERLASAERAEAERITTATTSLETRLSGAESKLTARIAALEAAQARIAAVESRATRR
jgi:hypothetical protein